MSGRKVDGEDRMGSRDGYRLYMPQSGSRCRCDTAHAISLNDARTLAEGWPRGVLLKCNQVQRGGKQTRAGELVRSIAETVTGGSSSSVVTRAMKVNDEQGQKCR